MQSWREGIEVLYATLSQLDIGPENLDRRVLGRFKAVQPVGQRIQERADQMADGIYSFRGDVSPHRGVAGPPEGNLARIGRFCAACVVSPVATSVLPQARADEPLFGSSYTTDPLPRGRFEFKQWSTTRFSKHPDGKFWLRENRTEQEYAYVLGLRATDRTNVARRTCEKRD